VGLPSVDYCEKNPQFSFELNVVSVQNALEAMRKTDIKRIVFASSAAVYGYSSEKPVSEADPTNPNTIYGHHKLIAEEVIRSYCGAYGLNYVVLRLFNVYGGDPHMGKDVVSIFIRKALKGEPIVVKGPKKFRDFVHVDDVTHTFVEAVTTNVSNIKVNVGTGIATSLGEIAEITKESFPCADIKYEAVEDDGTGLLADVTAARSTFDFSPIDSKLGIRNYVSSYAAKETDSQV
jgi:UDP-glucose 4-epimerase